MPSWQGWATGRSRSTPAGTATATGPAPYSYELLRTDVLDVLDALRIDRCVLAGHSMGATTAGLVTAAAPNRVAALILEDAVPPRPSWLERPPLPQPDQALPFDWPLVNALRAQLTNPDPVAGRPAHRRADAGHRRGPPSHIPQADLHELAARLANGRLVQIPVGHMVHVQIAGRVRRCDPVVPHRPLIHAGQSQLRIEARDSH